MEFSMHEADRAKNIEVNDKGVGEVVKEIVKPTTDTAYDFYIDYNNDMDEDNGSFYRDTNQVPSRPFRNSMMNSPSLGEPNYRDSSRDRSLFENLVPNETDSYSRDSINHARNHTFTSVNREVQLGANDHEYDYPHLSPSDMDFCSPRSRYDLACAPSISSRYGGKQWDRYDNYSQSFYDPLSPRYQLDSGRLFEPEGFSQNEEPDRRFSPSVHDPVSFSRSFQSEADSYPSSYTYGMRQPPNYGFGSTSNGYTVSFSSSIRNQDPRDNHLMEEIHRSPFSNPGSPQPMYSSVFSDPGGINDFGNNRMKNQLVYQSHSSQSHRQRTLSSSPGPIIVDSNKSMPTVSAQLATTISAIPANSPISPTSPQFVVQQEPTEPEEISYRIDPAIIMQNREERTVVLIRNIPNRYKLEDLTRVIIAHVHEKFNVLRLPIDIYTKRNLGYAFVNFSDSHEVLKLFLAMNGKRWPNSNSLKQFYICYAKKQNYILYENSNDNNMSLYL